MRVKYIAKDGTEFDSEELCEEHENQAFKKEYENLFGEQKPLKERVDYIIKEWKRINSKVSLSDEYLGKDDARFQNPHSITGEFRYGICFLRDDAVDLLVRYIEEYK